MRSWLIRFSIVCFTFCVGTTVHAAMIELDFEEAVFNHGTVVDNEYASAYGVSIFGTNYRRNGYGDNESAAVIFDTSRNRTRDPDLEAPFYHVDSGAALNPGNVLIIHERPRSCDARHQTCRRPDDEGQQIAGGFEFAFDDPVTVLSLDYFDIEANENNNRRGSEVRFFDAAGDRIGGNFFAPNAGGDNGWATLDFQIAGVSSMWVGLRGSGAIDRLAFESSAVPVPPAFALFLSALAGLYGFRKRQTPATA